MTDEKPTGAPDDVRPVGRSGRPQPSMEDEAWGMFGYVMSGILLWGGVGWLIDRWLDLEVLFVPIGVLGGAALGVYLGWLRFLRS